MQWAKDAWNRKSRCRHLYKRTTGIIIREGKLTVEQYFCKFQEGLRHSGKEMYKDGLRPDIRKVLAFTDFDSVADLMEAALVVKDSRRKQLQDKNAQAKVLQNQRKEARLISQLWDFEDRCCIWILLLSRTPDKRKILDIVGYSESSWKM